MYKNNEKFGIKLNKYGLPGQNAAGLFMCFTDDDNFFAVSPSSGNFSEMHIAILSKFNAERETEKSLYYGEGNAKAVYDALIAEFGYHE